MDRWELQVEAKMPMKGMVMGRVPMEWTSMLLRVVSKQARFSRG